MFIAMLTSVVSGPVLARAVGADGRGVLAVATTIASLLVLMLGAGFPVAARRYAAQGADITARLMSMGFRLALKVAPLAIVSGAVFALVAGQVGGTRERILVAAVVASAPLGVVKNFGAGCLTGRGDVSSLTMLRALPSIALSATYVVLALLGTLSVASALTALLLCAVFEAWLAKRPLTVAWHAPELLRNYWRFSLKSLPGQMAEASSLRLDQAILFAVLPAAALGRYVVAVSTASIPLFVLAALQARDFARVASASGQSAIDEAQSFVLRGLAVTALISVPMAVASPFLIGVLYGPEFHGLGGLVVLLFAGTVILSISVGGAAALVALERPGAATAGWLVAVASTIALEYPLARSLGIPGAGWVSVIAYSAGASVHLVLLRRAGVRVFSRESAAGVGKLNTA